MGKFLGTMRYLFSFVLILGWISYNPVIFASMIPPNCEKRAWANDEVARKSERAHVLRIAQAEIGPGSLTSEEDQSAVIETRDFLAEGSLRIYGAAFRVGASIFRIDMLERATSTSPFVISRISEATKIKPEQSASLARRAFFLRRIGYSVAQSSVFILNPDFRVASRSAAFVRQDLSTGVEHYLKQNEAEVETLAQKYEALEEVEEPSLETALVAGEEASQPDVLSILHVPWLQLPQKKRLLAQGISTFADLVAHPQLLKNEVTPVQWQMLRSAIAGERFVDKSKMRTELAKWDLTHPLIYLDFETLSTVFPRYPNARPHQQMPFQFSVLDSQGLDVHYLHREKTDPRPALIEDLLRAVPAVGSIVAWSAAFEKARLNEMARDFPEQGAALNNLAARLVDPLPILRLSFYDAQLRGSYSIKSVVPALFGDSASYNNITVQNGREAQLAYLHLIESAEASEQLALDMEHYVKKDTLEMKKIVEWMLDQIKN